MANILSKLLTGSGRYEVPGNISNKKLDKLLAQTERDNAAGRAYSGGGQARIHPGGVSNSSARIGQGGYSNSDARLHPGGVMSSLFGKANESIYSGLGGTISPGVLQQRGKQIMGNIDEAFKTQDLRKLAGRGNIKIRNTGGGGTPKLQDLYAQLTKRK